jgi:UTP--glucose-1-phosphate uridylyltransferase
MKAIIPAAGLGTRMLPVTKVVPKELLPIEGKPAIQWTLEEAMRAGLTEFIVVVSPSKSILRDYLTPLEENHLLKRYSELYEFERQLRSVKLSFVEQPKPVGLGDALLRCRNSIGDEPFALLLPDNVFAVRSRSLKRLIEIYHTYKKSCVALWKARGPALRDGAVIAEPRDGSVYTVQRVLSKSAHHGPMTDLRPIGRSVLNSSALNYLERAPESDGELDDVPLLDGLARDGLLLGMLLTEEFHHVGVGYR